jgi:hypothetical protein
LIYDVYIPEKKLAFNFLNPSQVVFNLDKNQSEPSSLILFSSNLANKQTLDGMSFSLGIRSNNNSSMKNSSSDGKKNTGLKKTDIGT